MIGRRARGPHWETRKWGRACRGHVGSARPSQRYMSGAEALTRREREVVALTVAGESAPGIAAALFLSERTVESHLARAYAKLGVHSKSELARRAAQLGVAPGSP